MPFAAIRVNSRLLEKMSNMSARVYVGRLSYRASERDIEHFFRGYGRIRDIVLKNGFGFVEFDDPRDADDAVYELNGKELCGERVILEFSRRGPRSRMGFGGFDRFPPPRRESRYGPPQQTRYRLIVENLSSRCSWQDLKDIMRTAGEVTFADAHKQHPNEGIVCFLTREDLERALDKLQGKEVNGRKLKLIDDSERRDSRSRSRSHRRSNSHSHSSRSRSSRSRTGSKSRSPTPRKEGEGSKSRSRSGSARSRSHSTDRNESQTAVIAKNGGTENSTAVPESTDEPMKDASPVPNMHSFSGSGTLSNRKSRSVLIDLMGDEDEIPDFRSGKVIHGQWKVIEKIGAGGCGAVYEVIHVRRKNFTAALKVESANLPDGGVLKLEAYVLGKLSTASKHTIRLLHSGKRPKYSFIVMTLCGPDLMFLRKMKGINKIKRDDDHFSFETTLRVAVHCLFAIKVLHEIGFVHRDVKPGNMVIGINGRDCRTIFMIDYGMVRSFVLEDSNTKKVELRKPRRRVLLRGTLRYCSPNVHRRMEQGRNDDLLSLLYMLIELCSGLPWNTIKDEKMLLQMKEDITTDKLFKKTPIEFAPIYNHLMTLKYKDRPDYKFIYDQFMKGIRRLETHFLDAYDWEDDKDIQEAKQLQTALSYREEDKRRKENKKKTEQKKIFDDPYYLDFRYYPTTDPKHFEEKLIPI
ncbi:Serine/arginine-rich splicing factor [Dirofilaria immitis]